MSTLRNPVGPQPPSVYWRRRIMVLLGLIAVIVVVVLIVVRPGAAEGETRDKGDSSTVAETPAAGGSGSDAGGSVDDGGAAAPAGDGELSACKPGTIAVEAVTDKTSYQPGEPVLVTMTVTNTGTAACLLNAGTDVMEFLITSGAEKYWSSKDCQTDAAPAEVRIEPAQAISTAPLTWDRTRSTPETCDTERPAVPAGGASYHLSVKLGDLEAASSRQFMLY
ncbi:hypothetical protein [Ruicaihuangia caeni]|uniref:hypothetical protein n=1 Tax=Ruicaihuangia caeni TaxID=3042517 RepID=UPI00338E33E2